MSGPDYYNTIDQEGKAEFSDRGSRFIAYACPIRDQSEFRNRLEELKKEHPKATHHCFAYRIGLDRNEYRANDDGEPSGTAGKPILGQIDSRALTNVLVVVVRYFGGTQLGVPGLIHAYRTASSLVLQSLPLIRKPVEIPLEIEFDYDTLNRIMLVVKQFQCSIKERDIQLDSRMLMGVPKDRLDEVQLRLKKIRGVKALRTH